jgi:hypothetical protein
MGEMNIAYEVSIGEPEWKCLFGRLRFRGKHNIIMDIKNVGYNV